MKLALILNVIDPKIGGVMIMGDRGTGKSTTIRALADLLPEMKVCCPPPLPTTAPALTQLLLCRWLLVTRSTLTPMMPR
jgi:Mg-chelatase subunit ChlI